MANIINMRTVRTAQTSKNEIHIISGCDCKHACYHHNSILPRLAKGEKEFKAKYCDGKYRACNHYKLLNKIEAI